MNAGKGRSSKRDFNKPLAGHEADFFNGPKYWQAHHPA
jgi:hypothetical protein